LIRIYAGALAMAAAFCSASLAADLGITAVAASMVLAHAASGFLALRAAARACAQSPQQASADFALGHLPIAAVAGALLGMERLWGGGASAPVLGLAAVASGAAVAFTVARAVRSALPEVEPTRGGARAKA
jgi:hypothetical protein